MKLTSFLQNLIILALTIDKADVSSVPLQISSPNTIDLLSEYFKIERNSSISTANDDIPLKILSSPLILVNIFL